MPSRQTDRKRSVKVKVCLTALAITSFGLVFGWTSAVFTSTTSNPSNAFSAGTVAITDNDSGSAMLSLTGAKPGDTDTSCIRVTYSGSLPASVRLYGATGGTGLDPYLTLTVTRGTLSSPTFDSCTSFSADTTNYIGAGNGVIYSGTIFAFADSYLTDAVVDPTASSPESWTTGETHDYKFVVTLANNDAAQGKTATQTFTWEARSS